MHQRLIQPILKQHPRQHWLNLTQIGHGKQRLINQGVIGLIQHINQLPRELRLQELLHRNVQVR